MINLAKAILHLASSIELSSDDCINSDFAVKLLEQLSYDLNSATAGEVAILKASIREYIVEVGDDRNSQQQEIINFYLDFMENIGINNE